jgi:hypothetical protein
MKSCPTSERCSKPSCFLRAARHPPGPGRCGDRELYTNLTREAFSLARLTNHPNFLAGKPDQTSILTTGLTTPQAGDDYAKRLRAYLIAPADGNYTFAISSDETSNLLLGTDENPATKQLIASVDPRAVRLMDSPYRRSFAPQKIRCCAPRLNYCPVRTAFTL